MFFEKWAGPVQTTNIIPEEQAAIITFHEQHALEKILDGGERQICGVPIKVYEYTDLNERKGVPQAETNLKGLTPSTCVVLECVPVHLSNEILSLMVQNISGLSENGFMLEVICESNTAVVNFCDSSSAGKFVVDSKSSKKFEKHNIKTRVLERSTCVKVENVSAQVNKDLLELYSEKWGGSVEKVDRIPEEHAAIITFKDQEATEKFLRKEHVICGAQVSVYPYFECLGTALYGSKRQPWKLPEPLTVNIHPAIRDFLLKKGLISSIMDQMASHFCKISLDTPEVQLSLDLVLLKQKGVSRGHITGWAEDVSGAFKDIMSKYAIFECAVVKSLWSTVEDDVRSVVKDLAIINIDATSGFLLLAGFAQDITQLKPLLEDIIVKATSHMERERDSVSEQVEMSPEFYLLLEQDGLDQTAAAISPQLCLNYKNDLSKLIISGLPSETIAIKNWILEKKLNMKHKFLKVDPSVLEFLRSVDCVEMSRRLFTSQRISAVCRIENENENVVLTGSEQRALDEAIKNLKLVLTFKTLAVPDLGVLEKPEYHALHSKLQNLYERQSVNINMSEQRDELIISGFAEAVKDVSHSLEQFIDRHSTIEEAVHVKSSAVVKFIKDRKSQDWQQFAMDDKAIVYFDSMTPVIKVSGERMYVLPAIAFLKKMAETLHTDTLIIKKTGAKKYFNGDRGRFLSMLMIEYGFVVVIEENNVLEKEDDKKTGRNNWRKEDFEQQPTNVRMFNEESSFRKENTGWLKANGALSASVEDLLSVERPFMKYHDLKLTQSGYHGYVPEENRPDGHKSVRVEGTLETLSLQGLNINLKKGNIEDAVSAVIVNTISEDVDLNQGAVSKALLKKAGAQLQSEATRIAGSTHLKCGEMVVTDGCNLRCSKVFHTVCPSWKGGSSSEEEVLRNIIRSCLKVAEKQEMTSVSFPAIATGNLKFPKDLVARIMLDEFQNFSTNLTPQHLQEVTVLVHPSDKESVECFTRSFKARNPSFWESLSTKTTFEESDTSELHGSDSTPSLGVYSMRLANLTLEVSSGDIITEKTDAIVNPSNKSFSLKAGVSKAILDAAGVEVEEECLQIVKESKQQTEIVTSAGKLPCRNIIHIMGTNSSSGIKEAVYSVLKLCEARKFTSVAFPALGTGAGGANPATAADAMSDAVVDFIKKNKPAHVKTVKFLIFQTSMVTHFFQCLLKRTNERLKEEKGFLGNILGKLLTWLPMSGKSTESCPEFVIVGKEFEPVVFQICGETPQDVSKAKDEITDFIERELFRSLIQDSSISSFTKEDVDMLTNLQRELTVSVKLEKRGQDSVITVEGLVRDVHTAESRIRDMIRKVDRNESHIRAALLYSSVVEWQYMDEGQNTQPFDKFTNYELEKAYILRNQNINVNINNEQYMVHLDYKIAFNGNKRIKLKRVDLKEQNTLPHHWDKMKDELVVLVNLSTESQEYVNVEKEFRKTGMTSNIIKIQRVQNRTLWRSYIIKKKHLEAKNKHTNNEKLLFHGTAPDKIDQINHHGFNRSFAGMNGALYGNGCYFAVDSIYSAKGYSSPDGQGHKRMYLVKVLVGEFTKGARGMLTPPHKNAESPDLYDSVTDNVQNPTMFVIFHDTQAYPEYLITFT